MMTRKKKISSSFSCKSAFVFLAKCLIVPLFFTALFFSLGRSDVGNFNDYDSAGSSGWSDSHSSDRGFSSFDRNSSSSDRFNRNSSADTWRKDSASSSLFSGMEKDDFSYLAYILIIGIGLLVIKNFMYIAGLLSYKPGEGNKYASQKQPEPSVPFVKWPRVPDHSFEISDALYKEDPSFDAGSFLEWSKEVFIKLQQAWMDRDWERVRPFESEELYAQHALQLQEYQRLGRINILERINVNDAYFFSFSRNKGWETLSVVMHVRMIDYIIDERTRRVIKGSPDKDCFLSYFYVFKRREGIKTTSAKQEVSTVTCPKCGAPTQVISSGRCEYCNSIVVVKSHGWVLSDIIGIKPPYEYGEGGVVIFESEEENGTYSSSERGS